MAKRKRVLIKSKGRRDLSSVADFLRQLADKLEGNELVLQQGIDEVKMTLPNQVVFKLKVKEKAKKKRTKQRLQIGLRWFVGEETDTGVTLG